MPTVINTIINEKGPKNSYAINILKLYTVET